MACGDDCDRLGIPELDEDGPEEWLEKVRLGLEPHR